MEVEGDHLVNGRELSEWDERGTYEAPHHIQDHPANTLISD